MFDAGRARRIVGFVRLVAVAAFDWWVGAGHSALARGDGAWVGPGSVVLGANCASWFNCFAEFRVVSKLLAVGAL
jgi:hypothetical protein